MGNPQIFVDSDGVLADFDRGFEDYFGLPPEQASDEWGIPQFWNAIERTMPPFYRNLPVCDGAHQFMRLLHPARPIVLTGCPLGGYAERQKIEWYKEHFPGVPVVCTMSKDKRDFCRRGDILIDDTASAGDRWQEAGGVFIHHTGSLSQTALTLHQITGIVLDLATPVGGPDV